MISATLRGPPAASTPCPRTAVDRGLQRLQPLPGKAARQRGFDVVDLGQRGAGGAIIGACGGGIAALLEELAAADIGADIVRVDPEHLVVIVQRRVEIALAR